MPRPKLAADLNTVLTRYAWPGNVRQLKNAIYRALTQLDGYELRPQDILLPDYDAATVAVGEDAMKVRWTKSPAVLMLGINRFIAIIPARANWQNVSAFHIPRLPISCGNMA